MKYRSIPSELFVRNREKLLQMIKPNSVVLVCGNDESPRSGDQFFTYRQNPDLFYLTGIDQERTILMLAPEHPNPKYREILFLVYGDKTMETWYGHKFTEEEAKKISGAKTVKWLSEFDSILGDVMQHVEFVYMNTNENPRFSTSVPYKDLRFISQVKNRFPLHEYKRVAPLITKLRLKKDEKEVEVIQNACKITNDAFHRVLKFMRPGVMEYEIEAEITHEFLRQGASGHAYSPIIASGRNACILHYPDNDKPCLDGDLILLDFGAEYGNYAADTTRTIPVNGKFSPRQRQVYEAVLRVMKQAINLMVPGKTINSLNLEVDALITDELVNLGLLKAEEVAKERKEKPNLEREKKLAFKYFMHGNSHFMGLDVHDVGSKDTPFEPGMLLSCEPGIYIPEENIGIRLENDILITDGKPIDLLASEPIEPDDIEALMRR